MDSQSLYRGVLIRAWNTTKNNAHFWILGFFVALLGNSGEFEFVLMQFKKLSSGYADLGGGLIMSIGTGGSNIFGFLIRVFQNTHQGLFEILLFIIIFAVVIWLAISSQGAIVRAIALSADLKKARLREHFFAGSSSFFSLLGIILLTRLGALFVVAVVGIPLALLLMYFLDPWIAGSLALFVIVIPLFMIASLISKYAIAYHMLERKQIGRASCRERV